MESFFSIGYNQVSVLDKNLFCQMRNTDEVKKLFIVGRLYFPTLGDDIVLQTLKILTSCYQGCILLGIADDVVISFITTEQALNCSFSFQIRVPFRILPLVLRGKS